jgi:polysaccharide pyruvyl transferase WcaK-like protein
MTTTTRRDVLLVGAYERDNFGDSLFLLATERLLEGRALASSVVSSDMTDVLGRRVVSTDAALRAASWRAVWVVGGEIGGVTVQDALPMSLADPLGSEYEQLSPAERTDFDAFVSGLDGQAPAYLPELGRYPRAADTRLVVHSVGLTGAERDADGAITGREAVALRGATSVTVREDGSRAAAEGAGIPVSTSPDLVHALPALFPDLAARTSTVGDERRSLVFQMNRGLVQHHGAEELAGVLVGIATEHDARVLLFPAGTARHHDSPEQYDELLSAVRTLGPDVDARVVTTRDPLGLAQVVASAFCWIGSSLHGRIVSSAYGVPRVSLDVDKVTRYATTWDPDLPAGVTLDEVPEAVRSALAAAGSPEQVAHGRELVEEASSRGRAVAAEALRG